MDEAHNETQLEQWVNRTVWMDGCDVETEYRQAQEEGRDLFVVDADFRRLIAVPKGAVEWDRSIGGERREPWLREAAGLVDAVQILPQRAGYEFDEPSDLEGIRRSRPDSVTLPAWQGDQNEWRERLHGGLLGRICGCMLGKPVEGWERGSIRMLGEETGNWPINDYWRRPTPDEDASLKARGFGRGLPSWSDPILKGGAGGAVEDDDVNYTVIGLAVVDQHGECFTPQDMAEYWCRNVPILRTCTAERVAYRNFVANVLPPESAVRRNPYREWIGAQIRADYFGYANPGRPERAAEWGWRDASISHIKNGIYGEMWAAAMIAAAFVSNDVRTIIDAGLAQIPGRCRLRRDIERIVEVHAAGASYEDAVASVHAQWDESIFHHWCHTLSNAQVVTLALLYGEDDYETTICRAVMTGFDTDCNAATCGSVWGIIHGASKIPEKWAGPMKDTVRTGVAGYYQVSIAKLADDMLATALKAR